MLINHENSQKIAERIGGILHRNVNIMDEEGRIVASTDPRASVRCTRPPAS